MPVKEESSVKGASRDKDAAPPSGVEGREDSQMVDGANADEDLYREYQGDQGGALSCTEHLYVLDILHEAIAASRPQMVASEFCTVAADGQGPDYEDDPAMVGGGGGADEAENYQDEDDLYADIVPGLAQVDGVSCKSDLSYACAEVVLFDCCHFE